MPVYTIELNNKKYKIEAENEMALDQAVNDISSQSISISAQENQPTESYPMQLIKNIPKSVGNLASGVYQGLTHPGQVFQGAASLGRGVLGKVLPEKIGETPIFATSEQDKLLTDSVKNDLIKNWGSIEGFTENLKNDPAGVLATLSGLGYGAGAGLSKLGELSKLGKISKLGRLVTKGAELTDPLRMGLKATGGVISKTGEFIANKTSGKKIQPFKKAFDQNVANIAQQMNVDLPISAQNKSNVLRLAEVIASKGFFGRKIAENFDNALNQIVEASNNVVKRIGNKLEGSQIGTQFIEAKDNLLDKFYNIKNNLYNKINLNKFNDKLIDTQNTQNILSKFLESEKKANIFVEKGSQANFYNRFLDGLKGKKQSLKILDSKGQQIQGNIIKFTTPENVKQILKRINKLLQPSFRKINNITIGDEAKLRVIQKSLNEEFLSGMDKINPAMAQAIREADDFFGVNVNRLNDGIYKTIKVNSKNPDKIFQIISKGGIGVEDLKNGLKLLNPDELKDFQATSISKIFENSKSKIGNKILPSAIENQLRKIGNEKLITMFSPEQIKWLKDIDSLAKSTQGFIKIAEGSQSTFLARLSLILSGQIIFGPKVVAGLLANDYVLSKLFKSQKVKQLLTSGTTLTGNTGRQISRIGRDFSNLNKTSPTLLGANLGNKLLGDNKND